MAKFSAWKQPEAELRRKFAWALGAAALSACVFDVERVEVARVDRPPSLDAGPDRRVYENQSLRFTVAAADSDGDAVNLTALTLPAGAGFAGGTFSWTPSYSQAGIYFLRFQGRSGTLADTDTVVIQVLNGMSPGFYAAVYDSSYDSLGYASEAVLDSNGSHRWFRIEYDLAMSESRGRWIATDSELTLSQQVSSSLGYGFFGGLIPELFTNFRPAPADTSPIRNLTDSSFEKHETGPDGRRALWVTYRLSAQSRPGPGRYDYRDTVFFIDTLGIPYPGYVTRQEYRFGTSDTAVYAGFWNDTPQVEIELPWTMAGSMLVADHPRRRYYDDSTQSFGPWADTLNGDWAIRLRAVTGASFEWYDSWYYRWAVFRREP